MVLLADLDHDDIDLLSWLLQLHQRRTSSARARWLLDGWDQQLPRWRKVTPRGAAEHVSRIRDVWSERLDQLLATPMEGARSYAHGAFAGTGKKLLFRGSAPMIADELGAQRQAVAQPDAIPNFGASRFRVGESLQKSIREQPYRGFTRTPRGSTTAT